jgi:pimeloyl-ACP methyl ester carboxylesterase
MSGSTGRSKGDEWVASRREFLKTGAILAGSHFFGGAGADAFAQQGGENPGGAEKVPASARLSGKLALQLGLCSAAVYQKGAVTDFPQWKETQVELVGEPCFSPEEDLRSFVGRAGETLVVAFRGTVLTEKRNWKTNIERGPIPLCDGANCKVHRGFLEAYGRLKAPLEGMIREAGEVKNAIFTGHSLGGALALIAAQSYQQQLMEREPEREEFEDLLVCTFGQPRVGDKLLAGNYRGKLVRFVNDFDPVPHVPLTGNYAQFGESVWFDRKQRISSKREMALRLAIEGTSLLKELRKLQANESLSDLAKREGAEGGKKLVEAVKNHRLEGPTGYLACLRRHAGGMY